MTHPLGPRDALKNLASILKQAAAAKAAELEEEGAAPAPAPAAEGGIPPDRETVSSYVQAILRLKDPNASDLDSILEISRDIEILDSDQQTELNEKLKVLTARLFPHASKDRILKQLDRIYSSAGSPVERAEILHEIQTIIAQGKLVVIVDILDHLIKNQGLGEIKTIDLIRDLNVTLPPSFWAPLPNFAPPVMQKWFIDKEKGYEWGSFLTLLYHEVPDSEKRQFFVFQIAETQREQVIEHTMRLIRDIEVPDSLYTQSQRRFVVFRQIHQVPWHERISFIETVEPHLKGLNAYPRAASLAILRRIPQGERATAAPNVVLLCKGVGQLFDTVNSMERSLASIPDDELANFVNVVAPMLKGLKANSRITSLEVLGMMPKADRPTAAPNVALLFEHISTSSTLKLLKLHPSDQLADFVNFVAGHLKNIDNVETRANTFLAILFLSPEDLKRTLPATPEKINRLTPRPNVNQIFASIFEAEEVRSRSSKFLIDTLNNLRTSGKNEEAQTLAQLVLRYSQRIGFKFDAPLIRLVTEILPSTET